MIKDGWIVCPHCHKKQFPVHASTSIAYLPWICKACKNPFLININLGKPVEPYEFCGTKIINIKGE